MTALSAGDIICHYLIKQSGRTVCNPGVLIMVVAQGSKNSQLCTSTAKQMYSFGKTDRFPAIRAQCPSHSYVGAYRFNSRRASFGYGKKYDFTIEASKHGFPDPTKYQTRHQSPKGKSFGVSRNQALQQSYICRQALKVPGPGLYNHNTIEITPVSYTMRPNYPNNKFVKDTSQYNPGPGAYKFSDTFTGLSKYQSGQYYSCPKDPRFKRTQQSPGPQEYQSRLDETAYKTSSYKFSGTFRFDKEVRKGFTEKEASKKGYLPGPGKYQFASDFGSLNPESKFKKASPISTVT